MFPTTIPPVLSSFFVARGFLASFEPVINDVVEELFCPEEPSVSLTVDPTFLFAGSLRDDFLVELIGLSDALSEDFARAFKTLMLRATFIQPAHHSDSFTCWDFGDKVSGRFGPCIFWRDGFGFLVDDVFVEGVFEMLGVILGVEERLVVALVLGEKPLVFDSFCLGVEFELAEFFVPELKVVVDSLDRGLSLACVFTNSFPPDVTKPNGREEVDGRSVGSVIGYADAPEKIIVVSLCNFLCDVKKAIFIKDARVFDFELAFVSATAAVLLPDLAVRVASVWVAIKGLGLGVRGSAVFVVVDFFYVFTMISLVAGETVESFFENGVVPIPESD